MPRKFYAADLAYVHDAGFLGFARRAAPWVLKRLARRCGPGARVVEIGCGSGGLTRELAGAGYRALGVDVSPAMIRLAREQVPAGRFRLASWYQFVPPPCDAIVAVGECFNYLSASPDRHLWALAAFLRRAGVALRPGGSLLFDFLEPCPDGPHRRTRLVRGAGWAIQAEITEHGNVITRRITVTRVVGDRRRISRETHRQLRLPRAQVERALRATGFVVTWHDGYGRHRFPAGHVVVEALRTFA